MGWLELSRRTSIGPLHPVGGISVTLIVFTVASLLLFLIYDLTRFIGEGGGRRGIRLSPLLVDGYMLATNGRPRRSLQ